MVPHAPLSESTAGISNIPPQPSLDQAAFAEVVFPLPLNRSFDYSISAPLRGKVSPGHRVMAPFGKRGPQMGVVVRCHSTPPEIPPSAIKAILRTVDATPMLTPEGLVLAQWMSQKYFSSLGEAVFTLMPLGKRLPPKKNLQEILPLTVAPLEKFLPLTPGQKEAWDQLRPLFEKKDFQSVLLWGVAAAGKTEIYLNAVAEVLQQGRSVHFLIPEISLTPQMEKILRGRFGDPVDVWHSGLSVGQRWRVWRRIQEGQTRVVLGPRSSLFLPLPSPGLIVMDEEHDPSYKQDSTPHYHAREAALEKGRLHGAVVLMGSATPSMETFVKTSTGLLSCISLPTRALDLPPPIVTVVDMKTHGGWYMSDALVNRLRERLERGEQSLLFLNRRGYATYVVCRGCDWEAQCPHCSVNLVYHEGPRSELPVSGRQGVLRCHYCFHRTPFPIHCPKCGKDSIKISGRGTQRVMADLKMLFPAARLLRWDRDTTGALQAHGSSHEAVKGKNVDIIVGTQMIAQGHDFPDITLVGILDADRSLRFPDFRAGERTFQLLTQVAGRAGRGQIPGEVILQTRHPDHYAIRAAQNLDYPGFAKAELAFRKEVGYPPYQRLILILLRARQEERTERSAETLMQWLENQSFPTGIQFLGPAPSFLRRRAGFSQWQIIIKSPPEQSDAVLRQLHTYRVPPGEQMIVDADPEELS